MPNKILSVILILSNFVFPAFTQVDLSGTIVDANTQNPIPYVNIGIAKIARGTVSDESGRFQFKNVPMKQIITFSSIGYQTLVFETQALIEKDTFQLSKMEYEIDPVEISASKINQDEILLGAKNESRGHSIGFGSTQLGTEIGSLIRIRKPTYLKSANFVLNHAKGDSLLFRVNVYSFKNGEIGENILKENILIREKQKKGVLTVDLEQYQLIVDSDVLLSLEWLRDFDEIGNKGITFDTAKKEKLKGIYCRFSSNGTFEKLGYKKRLKPCFFFIGIPVGEE